MNIFLYTRNKNNFYTFFDSSRIQRRGGYCDVVFCQYVEDTNTKKYEKCVETHFEINGKQLIFATAR